MKPQWVEPKNRNSTKFVNWTTRTAQEEPAQQTGGTIYGNAFFYSFMMMAFKVLANPAKLDSYSLAGLN